MHAMMSYVYILQSGKDKKFYVGSPNNLKRRLKEHNDGEVFSTKSRLPLRLVYYEACLSEDNARRREKYLKTSWGKRYIKSRLRSYLMGNRRLKNG